MRLELRGITAKYGETVALRDATVVVARPIVAYRSVRVSAGVIRAPRRETVIGGYHR